jgi:hypothetical protein
VAEDLPRSPGWDLDHACAVIKIWKERFPQFWPEGYRFYGPVSGMLPGDVAFLNLGVIFVWYR